jgi:hypothetical protein
MARKAKKPVLGMRLTKGNGWRLEDTKGKNRVFSATLLESFNYGRTRIAVFSVPKRVQVAK